MFASSSAVPAHRGLRQRLPATLLALLLLGVLGLTMAGCRRNKQPTNIEPAGEWLTEMRARITEKIDDADTAAALLLEVDALEVEVQAFDVAIKEYYTNLLRLDQDYNSSRAEFDALIQEFNATRAHHRDVIVGIRFRMRERVTPERWEIVADIDNALLAEWQRDFEF